jgi:hypothetical protein
VAAKRVGSSLAVPRTTIWGLTCSGTAVGGKRGSVAVGCRRGLIPVPVEFLSDEHVAAYGRFDGVLVMTTRAENPGSPVLRGIPRALPKPPPLMARIDGDEAKADSLDTLTEPRSRRVPTRR